jgi:hypothetical protein
VSVLWLARNGLYVDADLSQSTRGDGVTDQWRYDHGYDLWTDLGFLVGDGVTETWLLANGFNLLSDLSGSRSDGVELLWLAQNNLSVDADLSQSTRGDGVPDEWMYLNGYASIRTDLTQDSDGDGVSDYQEFLNGTDPHDYYNGQPHFFTLVEGGNQTGPPGAFLEYPWTVKVTDANGHFFANAPVTFWFDDDETGFFSETGDDSSPLVRKITVRTDEHGLAWIYVQQ